MKRVFKWLGILLGIVLLLAVVAALYINYAPFPTYPVKAPNLTVPQDSALVAEGRRIAGMLCMKCHMGEDGKLSGHQLLDMPPEFGKAWAPNITKGPKSKLSGYTDGELAYLIRTGIKRNGQYAPPWMVKLPLISDQDLNSIIAFIRSDAPEFEASDVVQPEAEPSFLAKFLVRIGAFGPLPYPEAPIAQPDTTDKVAFGRYLAVGKVDCFGCHSPDFKVVNVLEPEKTPGYFSGGNGMPNLEGEMIYTRNLTPDRETGIGNWTEEQFIRAVKTGQRDGKPAVRYPMEPFPALTDYEVSSIFAYLQTVPAIHNDIDRLYQGGSK